MRNARRPAAIVAYVVAFLWCAPGLGTSLLALAPGATTEDPYVQLAGIYGVKEHWFLTGQEQGWKRSELNLSPRIILYKGHIYAQGTIRGEYRLFPPKRIELCKYAHHDLRGDYAFPPDGTTPRLTFIERGDVDHKYVYERVETIKEPVPAEKTVDLHCGERSWISPPEERLALVASGVPFARIQGNTGIRRVARGELYLAANLAGTPGSDEDFRLWECLVTEGESIVEFVAPSLPVEKAYVWPDGRFLTELRAGATYGWWLQSFGCRMPERQYSGSSLSVPMEPASADEKIVLACIVADGRFTGCRAYWLRHP